MASDAQTLMLQMSADMRGLQKRLAKDGLAGGGDMVRGAGVLGGYPEIEQLVAGQVLLRPVAIAILVAAILTIDAKFADRVFAALNAELAGAAATPVS